MDELEQALNRVLSDPAEMEKLTRLAGSLLGGSGGGPEPGPEPPHTGTAGGGGDKAALVRAMLPYLKPKRREKLKKALAMARAAGVARLAMGQFGGAEDV